MRNFIRIAAAVLALCVLAAPLSIHAADFGMDKFKVGDKAPDFTLKDVNGTPMSLSGYAGNKVVLLVFFSLRCSTCLMEAPHVEKLHRNYGDDVVVLAINTDGVDPETAVKTMKEVGFEITYTVLLDPEFTATDTYTNYLVPVTVIVDKKGTIHYIHTGFEEGMEKEYEKALKKAIKS